MYHDRSRNQHPKGHDYKRTQNGQVLKHHSVTPKTAVHRSDTQLCRDPDFPSAANLRRHRQGSGMLREALLAARALDRAADRVRDGEIRHHAVGPPRQAVPRLSAQELAALLRQLRGQLRGQQVVR